ncbi:hypothetical protein JCM16358_03340 [Halanaerocella petrolearia]
MNQYALEYNSLAVSWFTLLSVISILLSYQYIKQELKEDLSQDELEGLIIKLVVGGFIGARVYYVLGHWQLYQGQFSSAFQISHLTLDLNGAIIGGMITLYLLSYHQKVSFKKLLDIHFQALTLGLAIGVWNYYFDNLFTYLNTLILSIFLIIIFSFLTIIKDKTEELGVVSLIFIILYLILRIIKGFI